MGSDKENDFHVIEPILQEENKDVQENEDINENIENWNAAKVMKIQTESISKIPDKELTVPTQKELNQLIERLDDIHRKITVVDGVLTESMLKAELATGQN